MSKIILLNKPYGVLSQFTAQDGLRALAEFVPVPGVYPAGRLDADSEGLLLLTDDGALQHKLANPKHKQPKVYFAQVEGIPTESALAQLRQGLDLGDFTTRRCEASVVEEPAWLWRRDPPIRFRQSIPTSWVRIVLTEGKNRQVRRMTAKVGFPTLRLVRWSIGSWSVEGLDLGNYRTIEL